MNQRVKMRNIDVKILEGLALHNPRNKSQLAAQLGMPLGTLRYRINYLRSHFSLHLLGTLYHTNIGLRKVVVFAESKPGYEELLYQCLKTNDYWLYLSQCVGGSKCLAIYGIPAGKEKEFEEFMHGIAELDEMSSVKLSWSTCFQNVNATSVWFDSKSEKWVFPWDSWLEEIYAKKTELPYTLKDPDGYVQKADWIDIIILKELEKNCTIKLKEIAKKLNMSLQRVKYHYENHVVKLKMFEGQEIVANHYLGLSAETYYFRFDFKNYENFAKFSASLLDKPFARAAGKVYGKNQLFVQIYLPRQELKVFIETLSKLVRSGFMETYEYLIQDMTKMERQTISYEYFKGNNWEYDHKKYMEKLQFTAEQFSRVF
jgi:DNA-binding Lrp family transcriptional regulator